MIKASDFTDNAVGIIHTTGPKLSKLARKYGPLVPALRELILRPDTPLEADVKDMIAGQLDAAQERFTAIGHGRDGDQRGQPAIRRLARLLLAAIRAPATAGSRLRETADADGRRDGGRAGVAGSGRQVPGDRGDDLAGSGGAADAAGSAKPRTDSLWTCLTVRRTRWVAG